MQVTMRSTSKIVEMMVPGESAPARLWEGVTANGIPFYAFICRVAVLRSDDTAEFEKELRETYAPSAVAETFPARFIL